jgi:hypothetical protein
MMGGEQGEHDEPGDSAWVKLIERDNARLAREKALMRRILKAIHATARDVAPDRFSGHQKRIENMARTALDRTDGRKRRRR